MTWVLKTVSEVLVELDGALSVEVARSTATGVLLD